MMFPSARRSRYFLPTLKETPAEAHIPSHRLMLRSGMIALSSAGLYSWLPLGLRVLYKVAHLVREEQNAAGAHEMLMPMVQSADLWKRSQRYDGYGKEMLRLHDRHGHDMLFGPTNEELITHIFQQGARSYRDCPQLLYQIQWKFRDEIRPRFGVMRAREFLMKDAYSFDMDAEAGQVSYQKMFVAYLKTFARMGLRALPMQAATGPIGGKKSHEFLVLSETGESQVFVHRDLAERPLFQEAVDYESDLSPIVNSWTHLYASTDDTHDAEVFQSVPVSQRVSARGIEVGHIFFFGDRYSRLLGGQVTDQEGTARSVMMGSYGIGISRLVGALIEAQHDEKGMIWPLSVAPFTVGLMNTHPQDEACVNACEALFDTLSQVHEVLYDDRSERAGVKFTEMELLGLPWCVVVGPRGLKETMAEVKNRATHQEHSVPLAHVRAFLEEHLT